jgi:trans-feruloyl-CoA hydratase/vanillin synthase
MPKSYQTIVVDKHDGVTTIRFNRPEKKNAMSPGLHRDMYAALSELEGDPETQVLVVTGNGDAFSAGQDLKEYFYELKDDPAGEAEIRRISHAWRHTKLYNFPRPTIAMINGWCFGGAFTTVASCDIAIAADEAVFGLSEINFGNIPGGIVTKVVSDLMLPRQALYYALTGDRFDGKKAVEIGFATLSTPRAQLEETTARVANSLKGKDAQALKAVKEVFKAVDIRRMSHDEAWYWLKARVEQLINDQKAANEKGGWIEEGIGKFMQGAYRPGLEAMPKGNP